MVNRTKHFFRRESTAANIEGLSATIADINPLFDSSILYYLSIIYMFDWQTICNDANFYLSNSSTIFADRVVNDLILLYIFEGFSFEVGISKGVRVVRYCYYGLSKICNVAVKFLKIFDLHRRFIDTIYN